MEIQTTTRREKMEYEVYQSEISYLREIMKFLDGCSKESKALIVNEVLMLNPMFCFNSTTKSLDKVESVCLNGEAIQLNVNEKEK